MRYFITFFQIFLVLSGCNTTSPGSAKVSTSFQMAQFSVKCNGINALCASGLCDSSGYCTCKPGPSSSPNLGCYLGTCQTGLCKPDLGGACHTDSDCKKTDGAQYSCEAAVGTTGRVCAQKLVAGTCTPTSDCQYGVCQTFKGTCATIGGPCNSSADCGPFSCQISATVSSSCATGLGGFCGSDLDCLTVSGTQYTCNPAAGYQKTSGVSICPSSNPNCNVCQTQTGNSGATCTRDQDCTSWSCVGGVCTASPYCASNNDCLATGGTGATCDTSTALCYTAAGTSCFQNSDCTSGICYLSCSGGSNQNSKCTNSTQCSGGTCTGICIRNINPVPSNGICSIGKATTQVGYCTSTKILCTENADCPTSAGTCNLSSSISNYCVPAAGARCTAQSDCYTLSGNVGMTCTALNTVYPTSNGPLPAHWQTTPAGSNWTVPTACQGGISPCSICQQPVNKPCSKSSDCTTGLCTNGLCAYSNFCLTSNDCTSQNCNTESGQCQ